MCVELLYMQNDTKVITLVDAPEEREREREKSEVTRASRWELWPKKRVQERATPLFVEESKSASLAAS